MPSVPTTSRSWGDPSHTSARSTTPCPSSRSPNSSSRAMGNKLKGRKIAILIESDYYEPEIHYYQHRFAEDGAEVHFVSRLWGNSKLTFLGHEARMPFECSESFE